MNFQHQISHLQAQILASLNGIVAKSNVQSQFLNQTCLRVPNSLAFNLDSGRYLKEITSNYLIDSSGYQYTISHLPLDQLAQLTDHFLNQQS